MTDDELLDHVEKTISDLANVCAARFPLIEASLNAVAPAVAKTRRRRLKIAGDEVGVRK